jgi:hypothetical protein
MRAMTDLAHSLDPPLTVGWYGNNCDCHDHCSSIECFAGDVNATLAYGYDSIKLDGCGWWRWISHNVLEDVTHCVLFLQHHRPRQAILFWRVACA